MACRSKSTIDEKIAVAQERVIKAKARYDESVAELEELLAKKKAVQNEELLKLFESSARSYEEIAAFLKDGLSDDDLALKTRKKPGRKPKIGV